MLRHYITILLGLTLSTCTLGVYGQSVIGQNDSHIARKAKSSAGHHKAVMATLTCLTPYVAGTTMDLTFRLSLTNSDEEYGDSLALIFPPEFTPVSSPNNPLYTAADPGAEPEVLNGVSGQVISWGDNDNSYGGIQPGSDAVFIVRVTIASGTSGDKTGNFHVSGDGYDMNGPAADYSGSFTLSATPPPADLSIYGFAPYPLYGTPINHTYAAPFVAALLNDGGNLTDSVNCLFVAFPGGFNDSKVVPRPFTASDVKIIESEPFTPAAPGAYYCLFSATFPGDDNNLDNKDTAKFDITPNYFSGNDGDTTGALALGLQSPGVLAMLVNLREADTLTTVNVIFSKPVNGARARALVFPFDTAAGTAGAQIAASQIVTLGSGAQSINFTVNQLMPAGNYLIGIEQLDSANFGMGTTLESYTAGYQYLRFGAGNFTSLDAYPAQFHRSYFVKAFFGDPGNVGIKGSIADKVVVAPNPSNGTVVVRGIDQANVCVIDNLGRVVLNTKISAASPTINLDQLQAGNYIIQLDSPEGTAFKQIALVK